MAILFCSIKQKKNLNTFINHFFYFFSYLIWIPLSFLNIYTCKTCANRIRMFFFIFLVGTRKQIQNLPDSIRISWWRIYYHFSYFAGINNIGNTDNQTNSQQHYLLTFFLNAGFCFQFWVFFRCCVHPGCEFGRSV